MARHLLVASFALALLVSLGCSPKETEGTGGAGGASTTSSAGANGGSAGGGGGAQGGSGGGGPCITCNAYLTACQTADGCPDPSTVCAGEAADALEIFGACMCEACPDCAECGGSGGEQECGSCQQAAGTSTCMQQALACMGT